MNSLLSCIIVLTLWNIGSSISAQITYYRDIQPIISEKCISCHQQDDIGIIPLTTYEEVSSYASMIKYVVETDYMPPNISDQNYRRYKNQVFINSEEKARISDWINSGLQKGSPTMKSVKADCIEINSDLEYSMQDSFEQYGIFYDQFHVFAAIPLENETGIHVRRIQFAPGNKAIVKACHIGVTTDDNYKKLDAWDPRYGYNQFGGFGVMPQEYMWYHWTPDMCISTYGNDGVKYLPPYSTLLLHMYYGPTSTAQKDLSRILIDTVSSSTVSAVKKSIILLDSNHISNETFLIPPSQDKSFFFSRTLEKDMTLHSLMVHGQLLCQEIEIFARLPEGETINLLKIEDYDFHWKENFELEEPEIFPAGTQINAIVRYDNTVDNYQNPAFPTTEIRWGDGMFEDKFILTAEVVE